MSGGHGRNIAIFGRLRGLIVAGAVVLAFPAGAAATTTGSVVGGQVHVTSGPEVNTVHVTINTGLDVWEIRDFEAPVAATAPCVLSGAAIQCPIGPSGSGLRADAGDGNDAIVYGDTLLLAEAQPLTFNGEGGDDTLFGGLLAVSRESGGSGNDRIRGGLLPDTQLGGPGADRLLGLDRSDTQVGGDGPDFLKGEEGRDDYSSGSGRDVVRARDFTKDLKIDCGSGRDTVSKDAFDPRPRHC